MSICLRKTLGGEIHSHSAFHIGSVRTYVFHCLRVYINSLPHPVHGEGRGRICIFCPQCPPILPHMPFVSRTTMPLSASAVFVFGSSPSRRRAPRSLAGGGEEERRWRRNEWEGGRGGDEMPLSSKPVFARSSLVIELHRGDLLEVLYHVPGGNSKRDRGEG